MKAKSDLTGDCKRPAEMAGPRTLCGATEWIRNMVSGILAASARFAHILFTAVHIVGATATHALAEIREKISKATQAIARLCREFLKSVQEVKIALPPGNGRCEP